MLIFLVNLTIVHWHTEIVTILRSSYAMVRVDARITIYKMRSEKRRVGYEW